MMYRVVACDRTTEYMKGSLVIPPTVLKKVQQIAGFHRRMTDWANTRWMRSRPGRSPKFLALERSLTASIIMSSRMILPRTAASGRRGRDALDPLSHTEADNCVIDNLGPTRSPWAPRCPYVRVCRGGPRNPRELGEKLSEN